MGRRNRRRDDDEPREIVLRGMSSVQSHSDGDWQVAEQRSAPKDYICPGCNQTIAQGTPNTVAWRDGEGGEDRRHWHKGCWSRRTPQRY
jgi:hypothetical protein